MARTLRITNDDGSLDVTLREGSLAYMLVGVIAAKRDTVNARHAGAVQIESRGEGGYVVKLSGHLTETLATIPPPSPPSPA